MNDDIELLESTHEFPCEFTIKAIGSPVEHFVGRVLLAIQAELGEDIVPPFSTRQSSSGRHISVTVTPMVQDAQQVLAIYAQLREVEGLMMLL